MIESTKPWFEELTVTPLIEHAVEVLRTAIPAGQTGIGVSISDGEVECYDSSITDEQVAAYMLLAAVAAYHHEQMIAAYGVVGEDGYHMPPELQAAQQHFDEDVRRKLNIQIYGDTYEGGLNGTVSVSA